MDIQWSPILVKLGQTVIPHYWRNLLGIIFPISLNRSGCHYCTTGQGKMILLDTGQVKIVLIDTGQGNIVLIYTGQGKIVLIVAPPLTLRCQSALVWADSRMRNRLPVCCACVKDNSDARYYRKVVGWVSIANLALFAPDLTLYGGWSNRWSFMLGRGTQSFLL